MRIMMNFDLLERRELSMTARDRLILFFRKSSYTLTGKLVKGGV
jgi:hypothetical protein